MPVKILVADDEADLLKVIEQTLVSEKYDVITASDGREALEKIREQDPDLVILDINMPYMDGFKVCKELRQDPLYKNIPIVFLTVRMEKEDKIKGMELGSDEYIIKPFRPKELLLRIDRILKSK